MLESGCFFYDHDKKYVLAGLLAGIAMDRMLFNPAEQGQWALFSSSAGGVGGMFPGFVPVAGS